MLKKTGSAPKTWYTQSIHLVGDVITPADLKNLSHRKVIVRISGIGTKGLEAICTLHVMSGLTVLTSEPETEVVTPLEESDYD